MANTPRSGPDPGQPLPPLPISHRKWETLAKSLNLSHQQERIVELILRDLPDKHIADALKLTVPTVRTYLNRIYARLGVKSRMALVLRLFAMSHVTSGRDDRRLSK